MKNNETFGRHENARGDVEVEEEHAEKNEHN